MIAIESDTGALMHMRRTGHKAGVDGRGVWSCVNCDATGSLFAQEADLRRNMRTRVLELLGGNNGISTTDLSAMLMSPQSVVSRVLRTLRNEGLVESYTVDYDRRLRLYRRVQSEPNDDSRSDWA